MIESAAQRKHKLASDRKPVGMGVHKYDESCIITEDIVNSSEDEANVQTAQAPSASSVEGCGIDDETAELRWRNAMWKSLSAEPSKRSKISSGLSRLRSTTAWQKAALPGKIRMNELEICRVSSRAGRSSSPLTKNFSGMPLYKTKSKTKLRRHSGNTENNVLNTRHGEQQLRRETYVSDAIFMLQEERRASSELVNTCPLSGKRTSGTRYVTGLLRDFTKSLEMTTDINGNITKIIKGVLNAG